jgi:hypothetical protein
LSRACELLPALRLRRLWYTLARILHKDCPVPKGVTKK